MKIILHIDMDSFFTSCEELRRPKLKGKPVVVGADPRGGKGRGVVSTASYAARGFGIHSGMPISIAYKKCPDCVFLPVDFELYVPLSQKIMGMLGKYSGKVEPASIDEAYLDLSDCKDYKEAVKIAEKIKQEIRGIGLSSSIGIGPNKLIAKIASDYEKPNGLTVVKEKDAEDFLKPMNVKKIPGIGPKTSEYLKERGVETIKDLQKIAKQELKENFGKFGETMYYFSRGIDDSEVVTEYEAKSYSKEFTFQKDTESMEMIQEVMLVMAEELSKELKTEKKRFKTVTLKIRFSGFETHTTGRTMKEYTDRKDKIYTTADELLQKFLPLEKAVRLIGIKVSNFEEKGSGKKGLADYI